MKNMNEINGAKNMKNMNEINGNMTTNDGIKGGEKMDDEWMMKHEYKHISLEGLIIGSIRQGGLEAALEVMNSPNYWLGCEREMWALNMGSIYDDARGGSINEKVGLMLQTRQTPHNTW
jgi:hypothetical protein